MNQREPVAIGQTREKSRIEFPIVFFLWNKEIKRVVELPEMKPRWLQEGVDPVGSMPEQFRQALHGDIAKWTQVAKRLNLQAAE